MSEAWKLDSKSAAAPILLGADEASRARFCFMGEFGYEMVSWIPYLLFLKQTLGIPLRTMGRTGSSIFYGFSDDHIELNIPPGDCWGELPLYERIASAHPRERLVHPGPEAINRRTIVVGGYDWRNRDIHGWIDTTHYQPIDLSFVAPIARQSNRPLAVINNKYFVQWPSLFKSPINFLDRPTLIEIRDLLTSRGYDVVYNHYVEKTAYDVHGQINDTDLFTKTPGARDLRAEYEKCANVAERNRLQLATYNAADLVIGPQGGNLYLPAICGKDIYLLMRVGNYLDYPELGRIYGGNVEMFYEPKHMINWLDKTLAAPSQRMREAA